MKLPTKEQCFNFYKELNTPDNIIRHVIVVNKIANFLAQKLVDNGIKLDLDLVDIASLLHDLDKWPCINDKNLEHGIETEKILTKKGYRELGYYCKMHILELITDKEPSWEIMLITYSDKRVNGDEIVSLKERFDYINQKYPAKDRNRRNEIIQNCYNMEKKIFSVIKIKHDNLIDYINK